MAKKEEKSKIVLERTYNVPLRKEFLKVPKYKRAKKAVTALRQFLVRHMKSDDVKILGSLNEKVWDRGIKNPPHHVKVSVTKDDKGVVRAELFGAKKEPERGAKKAVPKKAAEKPAEKPEEAAEKPATKDAEDVDAAEEEGSEEEAEKPAPKKASAKPAPAKKPASKEPAKKAAPKKDEPSKKPKQE